MPTLETFSADIIYDTMTSLPDFQTLLSFMTTSKAFYTMFQYHPQSIIRAVAYNQVGDALPQALRLVRCDEPNYNRFPIRFPNVNDLPEENMMNTPIQPREARMLAINARVAHALEDLFSWR
jgi:hypothetical protein